MGSFHGMDNDPVNIGSLITASVTSHRVSGRFCKFAARNIIVMRTTEVGDRIKSQANIPMLKMKQQQHDINLRRTRKKKIRVPDGI